MPAMGVPIATTRPTMAAARATLLPSSSRRLVLFLSEFVVDGSIAKSSLDSRLSAGGRDCGRRPRLQLERLALRARVLEQRVGDALAAGVDAILVQHRRQLT